MREALSRRSCPSQPSWPASSTGATQHAGAHSPVSAPGCCRENFLAALAEHGLGWTDIVPNVNFFCAVPIYEEGRLPERTFVSGPSRSGDHIDLRAERDVLAIVSNCPQVNNPAAGGATDPDPCPDSRIRCCSEYGFDADRRPDLLIPHMSGQPCPALDGKHPCTERPDATGKVAPRLTRRCSSTCSSPES